MGFHINEQINDSTGRQLCLANFSFALNSVIKAKAGQDTSLNQWRRADWTFGGKLGYSRLFETEQMKTQRVTRVYMGSPERGSTLCLERKDDTKFASNKQRSLLENLKT